jgi:hypothetical protein
MAKLIRPGIIALTQSSSRPWRDYRRDLRGASPNSIFLKWYNGRVRLDLHTFEGICVVCGEECCGDMS